MKPCSAVVVGAALSGLVALFVVAAVQNRQGPADQMASSQTNHADRDSFTNHLINEKSPYLQQHAHNPVDWYPWGNEAFDKARKENKPIFLSVGYSTCHWCHVMEHESFENVQIARLMNENFICIKVDREERPDVDNVYMSFVQATTGSGGWPMSVWLTPELKPFLGGTYYPPEQFAGLMEKIAASWRTDRDKIVSSSDAIIRQLRAFSETSGNPAPGNLDKRLVDKTYEQIKSSYDPQHGGFGSAPKFPRPVSLDFLLRYYARTGKRDALDMALFTLRKMAEGGMHDLIGGGFHRYSTDAYWRLPHFEKMLYDQAQLACAYLDAYQIKHEPFFAEVAHDILDCVQRDMTGEQGQFYSAEDADSPLPGNPAAHAEGAFYVWQQAEIAEALGREPAAVFDYCYGMEPRGNIESDPRRGFLDKNVLFISHTVEEAARKFGKSPDDLRKVLEESRKKLFAIRAKRPRPHLDDKTITAWNGLMISAFARGYQVLGEQNYLLAASKSALFIKSHLYNSKTGTLLRRYRVGEAAIPGFAQDYAFLIQGLLDLYESSFDVKDLIWALDLQNKQNELFWDSASKGFFSTTGKDPSVLLRAKEDYDGAEPSPNSVAALNLLRLSQMLDEKPFREMAQKTLAAFGARLQQAPSAMPQMMAALDFSLAKSKQIVIAGKPNAADTRAMFRAISEQFVPDKIVLLADGGEGQAFLRKHLDFIRDVSMKDGKTTAFVCQDYVCQLPTSDLQVMRRLITDRHKSSTER